MNSYCEESCICCRDRTIEKDCFEQCYTFVDVDTGAANYETLWEADGVTGTSGTLILEVTSITPGNTLDIVLNGVVQGFSLDLNASIIITSDELDLIQITPSANDTDVTVELCLNVNYECC